MNTLFKNYYERKRRRCNRNIHNSMQIPVDFYQTNKKCFVRVQQKNEYKLELADHLLLPFIVQLQSDIAVLEIITFIYITFQ